MTIADVIDAAACAFRFDRRDIVGPSRVRELVAARDAVVHLARRRTDKSLAQIGRALGGRDHSTIIAAESRALRRYANDPVFRRAVDKMAA